MRQTLIFLILNIHFIMQPAGASEVPQRIVSINLCTDELLIRLVDREQIAAVAEQSGHENNSAIYEQAKGIPKTSGEIEEVLAHEPDLVIGGTFSKRYTFEFLKRLKIPYLVLEVAEDIEGIYANILAVGKAVGEEKRALELIEAMKHELNQIGQLSTEDNVNALFYQSSGNVPGANTFQEALLSQIGVKNLAAQSGLEGHGYFSLEQLLFQKPHVLIFYDLHKNRSSVGRELLFHPAMRRGLGQTQTITMPSKYLNCGAPSSVEAVRMIKEKMEQALT